MLLLKNVKKDYVTSSETVSALKGVSLAFRKKEFVSILGPSGCGKTTLLNIVGGLDQYTEGDLIINGRSTKEYRDREWDSYRNHSIGFVFQSYNLIPHQTVLGNVEIALTLSGVSREERRKRAIDALTEVGLGDQINKRPSEMSGGQMQRVAIARALVNNPDIILADEPTGALDTKTSVQVMDILKKVSSERLVIMVTHNPELADAYSSRIIRMLDGNIVDDSNPYSEEECMREGEVERAKEIERLAAKGKKEKKPSMSFFTSFMLSLKNLFTKKGRTALTSFAGSIGIIGIALILAVSQGMTAYINDVQESALTAYPISLETTNIDIASLMESFTGKGSGGEKHPNDAVYKDPLISELVDALSKIQVNENDLGAFKTYLEAEMQKDGSPLSSAVSGIQYIYNLDLTIYTKSPSGKIIKSDKGELMTKMLGEFFLQMAQNSGTAQEGQDSSSMSSPMMSSMMDIKLWEELLPGLADKDGNRPLVNHILYEQYDVVHGAWPKDKNEIVLVLDENNELDDLTLYALGLLTEDEINAIIEAAASGKPLEDKGQTKWTYEEICQQTFKTIFPFNRYRPAGTNKNGVPLFYDASKNETMLSLLYESAEELRVSGIIRPKKDAEATMIGGSIGYTYLLTEHIINEAQNSEVVKAQLENPDYDVLTGLPFKETTGALSKEDKKAAFISYVSSLDDKGKADAYLTILALEKIAAELDTRTDMTLGYMNDKDVLIGMIIAGMQAEDPTFDPSTVTSIFENMTIEKLKETIRPGIEESIKATIYEEVKAENATKSEAELAALLMAEIEKTEGGYTLDQYDLYYNEVTEFSLSTYENNLITFGCLDLDVPYTINLFASTFENKDVITKAIKTYNKSVDESKRISYTDIIGMLMSSITIIIQAITYVLIAFVAISLVVSSIMIGVITLISVQERTKEIGILRAIGASKKNVSSMFNAETMIIGLASGILGVVVTYILCIPINLILHSLTGIENLNAILPLPAAFILIAISVLLTLISGIIPSRSAAKKDPVVALRTE